jgi:hypothetical protein
MSSFNYELLARPLTSAGVAILLDRFVLKETDIKKNLIFGSSVSLGISLGAIVGSKIPFPTTPTMLGNGKEIGQRLTEVAVGGTSAFIVNKYIMKNDSGKASLLKKALVVVVADVAGEYACDYFSGRPLAVFA